MKRSQVTLTPTLCQRTKAGSKRITLWDAEVLGLGLVVEPSGTRSWYFVARREGKPLWIRIGEYQKQRGEDPGAVWTLDAARGEAARLRKLHDQGKDIRAAVKEMRKPRTLAELALEWQGSVAYRELARRSRDNYGGYLKNHIIPHSGKRLVADLHHRDIVALHKAVEDKGFLIAATYVVKTVSVLMDYAVDLGWREWGENPCRKIKMVNSTPRSRIAKAAEMAVIGAGMGTSSKAAIIRLVAVSGMRIEECCGLEWRGVDLEAGTLSIFDHKTKKKAGVKVVPLNAEMAAVLQAQRGRLSPWVFPGMKDHLKAVTVQVWWAGLMRELKIDNFHIHDLRRTFQTTGVELGYPPGDMDVLVGHKLPGMQATYVHLSPGGILAQASAVTSAWMAAALDGKSPRIGERVGGLEEKKA